MNIVHNQPLGDYNTFHINEMAREFAVAENERDLQEIIAWVNERNTGLKILGGGSNILLTQTQETLVVLNRLKGIRIINETAHYADIEFMSGENWHESVLYCVDAGLGGIENLSLIPGTTGAAPIQNIGAYGKELKDVFVELCAIDTKTLDKKKFTAEDCRFGYRDSIFKHSTYKHYFILSVTLRLQKEPVFSTEYGDIKKILAEDFNNEVSVRNISDAVIKIRKSKLPDPSEIGNAGSFFKNPLIPYGQSAELRIRYPEIPFFENENGVKIPAAWLIEQCKWKGFRAKNFGVHERQALVLVNYGDAPGRDILALSNDIITSVQQRFNIRLEREVNIW